MSKRAALFVASLFLFASCDTYGPPRAHESEYVISKGAGFEMSPEHGVVYGMIFELRKSITDPVYFVALFENPENPSVPLRTEAFIEPGAFEFIVRSPALKALKNKMRYTVNLLLYKDSGHTQLLGKHQQDVLFDVPPRLETYIEETYSIRIM